MNVKEPKKKKILIFFILALTRWNPNPIVHLSFSFFLAFPASYSFFLFILFIYLFLFLFFKRRKKEKKKGVSGNDGDMPWSLLVPGPIIIKDVTTDQVDCHVHPFFFFLQFEKNKIKLRKIKEKIRKGLIGKK